MFNNFFSMIFYQKSKSGFGPWARRLVISFCVILLIVGWGMWQITSANGRDASLVSFTIDSGQGVKVIGANLIETGLISSPRWFRTWVYVTGTEKEFIAGDYKLPKNSSILNLTRLLTGASQPESEVTVTIIEGWTLKEIANYLESSGVYNASEFIQLTTTPDEFNPILDELEISLASKPAAASLEGYLFPDTYRVYRDSTASALVTKMLDNFAKKFKLEWRQALEDKGYNVWQGVILASIVEREVSSLADRKMVADIFWRRLNTGQGLQADSTVNYITGKKTPSVSLEDTKLDSPYKTYKYRGLSPGPISNPGAEALEAVAFPTANNYWYFLTTPEGQVIYSKTFADHIKAKQKYLY